MGGEKNSITMLVLGLMSAKEQARQNKRNPSLTKPVLVWCTGLRLVSICYQSCTSSTYWYEQGYIG